MREEIEKKPLIMRLADVTIPDQNIYDGYEKYDHLTDMLDPGRYWMGSNKTNTRCNKFTILGADKTHADDTKEKS
jgi:hypothetical protein